MYTSINEKIEALVYFSKTGPLIKAFMWKKKLYKTISNNFIYQSSTLPNKVYFMVTAQDNTYKIGYDLKHQIFELEELYTNRESTPVLNDTYGKNYNAHRLR